MNKLFDSLDELIIKEIFSDPIRGFDFYSAVVEIKTKTNTPFPDWKIEQRLSRLRNLLTLLSLTRSVPGVISENGVFKGISAKLMAAFIAFTEGEGRSDFFFVDSFEGLSEPTEKDFADPNFKTGMAKGQFSLGGEKRKVIDGLKAIPRSEIFEGFIPEVYSMLPEASYRFVHVDVDLYEPTLEALKYYWPRMSMGGIIVNDDYGSKIFRGSSRAWDEFCESCSLKVRTLISGQSYLIKME